MNLRKFFIGRGIGFLIILILALLVGGFYALNSYIYNQKQAPNGQDILPNQETEYVSYKSSEYSPEFVYPKSWGEVVIKEGNKTCPEEDAYRTVDTLSVFDWEYFFSEMKLPNSDSMIRTGVRLRELDPKNLNTCGDEFLYKVATKEIDPRVISSVMLQPITNKAGLSGIYTIEASRLNTESRRQYTFFMNKDSRIYILQPYMSFIPYFDSPELKEMEGKFGGDMRNYLEKGITAENIRNKFEEFRVISESLKFTGE
ncbi:MAG TPA: hypothetical protein VJB09_02280 [Candidatus Paceibacterota bacterium]